MRGFPRGLALALPIMLIVLVALCGCARKAPEHGVEFVVELAMDPTNSAADQQLWLAQTTESLRRRVEEFDRLNPFVWGTGSNRVLIQLSSLPNADEARFVKQITNSTALEFRLVHEASEDLVKRAEVPPGYELLKGRKQSVNVKDGESFVVKKERAGGLDSRAVQSASVTSDQLKRPQIQFQLQPEAARKFAEVTRDNIGHRLAIVVNGEVFSAPRIQTPIENGTAMIAGEFSETEAREFALTLSAPLPVPVIIVTHRSF